MACSVHTGNALLHFVRHQSLQNSGDERLIVRKTRTALDHGQIQQEKGKSHGLPGAEFHSHTRPDRHLLRQALRQEEVTQGLWGAVDQGRIGFTADSTEKTNSPRRPKAMVPKPSNPMKFHENPRTSHEIPVKSHQKSIPSAYSSAYSHGDFFSGLPSPIPMFFHQRPRDCGFNREDQLGELLHLHLQALEPSSPSRPMLSRWGSP